MTLVLGFRLTHTIGVTIHLDKRLPATARALSLAIQAVAGCLTVAIAGGTFAVALVFPVVAVRFVSCAISRVFAVGCPVTVAIRVAIGLWCMQWQVVKQQLQQLRLWAPAKQSMSCELQSSSFVWFALFLASCLPAVTYTACS